MDQTVIDVRNLTIRFNMASEKIDSLKEYAIKFAKRQLRFQEFLALDDVTFQVKKGEAWGLVGPNGAGKSTLLKTVSGILQPYKGSVSVKGRISPLIELGAGFDKNLTARENIFLNGLVLGHSREFMEEHFDEIVDFANIGKFLDSPIKNFSSGMKARLGFAVATVVDPEILIVDEVLEVGDYRFRKKCSERMQKMLSGGTTLLFVSHNIDNVLRLCDHAIWLEQGKVRMTGEAKEVCSAYRDEQEEITRVKKEEKRAKLREKNHPYDYLIVGAGLYGAVFAREMRKCGKRCLVIDRRSHIGGNIYTRREDGIDIHEYGAHIFHTSDERVWKYVNHFVTMEPFVNSPLAVYRDELFNLPFNMNTFHQMWGVRTPQEARDKIAAQIASLGIKEPANLEEQALSMVGPDVYEKLVRGYTEKQWGRDCKDLPSFIIKRLPLRFTYDNNYFNDRFQGIPQEGYTRLIEALLANTDILLDTDYKVFAKEHPELFRKVVYTGMIDEFFDFRYGHLEYRSLEFETERLEMESFQGNAVVNYTERQIPYTRIIEHKYFRPRREREEPSACTWISREYPKVWEPGMEPYYPVNNEKNAALYQKYLALAEKKKKVIFGGRLGEYRYYDMDQTIAAALKRAETEIELF